MLEGVATAGPVTGAGQVTVLAVVSATVPATGRLS